ncbi:hypothetical protein EON83_26365 [bacterium]|nr:MAG: hypothetical protein EON83_26365 [bacterium]
MPRPRKYASDAERQAAYRDRHAAEQPPNTGLLAAQARSLHSVIKDAAKSGDNHAQSILGKNAAETLSRLIADFKCKAESD